MSSEELTIVWTGHRFALIQLAKLFKKLDALMDGVLEITNLSKKMGYARRLPAMKVPVGLSTRTKLSMQ